MGLFKEAFIEKKTHLLNSVTMTLLATEIP